MEYRCPRQSLPGENTNSRIKCAVPIHIDIFDPTSICALRAEHFIRLLLDQETASFKFFNSKIRAIQISDYMLYWK